MGNMHLCIDEVYGNLDEKDLYEMDANLNIIGNDEQYDEARLILLQAVKDIKAIGCMVELKGVK